MECSTENSTYLFDLGLAAIKDESSIDIFCDKYLEKYQDIYSYTHPGKMQIVKGTQPLESYFFILG